jgi:hypothetical protein
MQDQALRSITDFPKLRQTGINMPRSGGKYATDKPRVKYCLFDVCFVNSTGWVSQIVLVFDVAHGRA